MESTVQGTSRVEPAWGRPQIVGAAARISETMRTFARLFGTGFAVLLLVLAATAQAGGGKAVTPPSAGLVAGLSPALSYILKRFYDCIVELGADHTLPGTYPMIHIPMIARRNGAILLKGSYGKARRLRTPSYCLFRSR